MPHVIIEHSADVAQEVDLAALCDAVFDALTAHPEVPDPAALKVRTIACAAHRGGTTPDSFAHATLLLLPGRDAETKADMTQTILDALAAILPRTGSLSVNLADLDPAYVKRAL
ncbi:5-carboxymethyl-2-hydroxymuconate isomerase [Roseovarius spongiae]|uniref:5-carboxymethyl-2-hydroxymuconate isomerase n=1 Tax=Roseovarius spongiae TaxID=2320272 RepID=A0A3A8B8T0_9RHOB|nr:5-carboxymethyl-2-hydroxymuconate isomerase [Roseovarius spongiae]RKF14108.1 5-carboxymethyl-2-hydroxymuconate isomerase [Roseovarius spongiae]